MQEEEVSDILIIRVLLMPVVVIHMDMVVVDIIKMMVESMDVEQLKLRVVQVVRLVEDLQGILVANMLAEELAMKVAVLAAVGRCHRNHKIIKKSRKRWFNKHFCPFRCPVGPF